MVHVRTDGGGESPARACEPSALVAEGGDVAVRADTLVSTTGGEGTFAPLATALEQDGALRDEFARAIPVPSLTAWWRMRLVVVALAIVPLVMLLELDRELVSKDLLGPGRLAVDVLLAAYVGFELSRRTPRMPAVAGAALLAVAMRWALVVVRFCGKGTPAIVWAAAGLSVAAAFAVFARAPSRARVALEILGKLGISRGDALATKASARAVGMPSGATVAKAAVAAAGLPLLLWLLRRGGVGIWPQAAAFVAYAAIVPWIVQRSDATEQATERTRAKAVVVTTLIAIPLGLALTAALLHGTHYFFDAGGELARCTGRLDDATRRLLAAEATELSRRIAAVRASTAVVVMSTAVIPLAEERIYRGLLMNVLVRKYGFRYGLFASAAAFGVAHVGIYEIALYQTVLLGIGFGLAYAEGGLVAAFVVHAVWNLLNVA